MHKDKKKNEEEMGEGERSRVSNYNLNVTDGFLDNNFIFVILSEILTSQIC
jgi:hypothetical protein